MAEIYTAHASLNSCHVRVLHTRVLTECVVVRAASAAETPPAKSEGSKAKTESTGPVKSEGSKANGEAGRCAKTEATAVAKSNGDGGGREERELTAERGVSPPPKHAPPPRPQAGK